MQVMAVSERVLQPAQDAGPILMGMPARVMIVPVRTVMVVVRVLVDFLSHVVLSA